MREIDAFDQLLDKRARGIGGLLSHALVINGLKEPMVDKKKSDRTLPTLYLQRMKGLLPVATEITEEQIDQLNKTFERYEKKFEQFRGRVKNDIHSIQASARATDEAVNRIGKAYSSTAEMLTTPEFERAIHNAERMAAALQAISSLQNHSITFAILDRKSETQKT